MNNTLNIALCSLALASGAATALEPLPGSKTTVLLDSTTAWDGQPMSYPSGPAALRAEIVELAPGAHTGWHEAGVPAVLYLQEGALEIRRRGGQLLRLQAGAALAVPAHELHDARALGERPARLLLVYAAAEGRKTGVALPEFEGGGPTRVGQ